MTDNSENTNDNRSYKETSQPLPTKLELEELSTDEINYVSTNNKLAGDLLDDLGHEKTNHRFDPGRIAQAINTWFSDDLTAKYDLDMEMYSDCLAVAWGKYLEEELGMTWHVITDEYGTEIGLYHKSNNVTLFPFTSLKKCLQNEDSDLIVAITERTKKIISDTN